MTIVQTKSSSFSVHTTIRSSKQGRNAHRLRPRLEPALLPIRCIAITSSSAGIVGRLGGVGRGRLPNGRIDSSSEGDKERDSSLVKTRVLCSWIWRLGAGRQRREDAFAERGKFGFEGLCINGCGEIVEVSVTRVSACRFVCERGIGERLGG
jgi:hypothetical protein